MQRFSLALLCSIALAGVAFAKDDALEKDRKRFADWKKTLEGMRDHPGFMTLYTPEEDKKQQEGEKLWAAVPKDLLDKPFFLATSVSGGSNYAGWQWEDKLVKLVRFDKQLMLLELNTRQRAKKDAPISEVVRRTYEDRLVTTIPIVSIGPEGQFLFDIGELLAGRYSTFFGGFFSLRSNLARFVKTKAFPKNIEVAVRMPLYGDGTFMTLHYSISFLPEKDDYTPRLADDRLGYFLTAIRDYVEGDPQDGRMVRYVNRWRLEKADPKLKKSPPKEPIVFYVEKTVPIAYRQAVHEGILEWNKAFEQVGIQGAIVVRQQTDTQFADVDPEDVRYNFFRWITSEQAFAMGPSRVDPRSGRILDADIIFDDSMLRGYMRDYDILIREGPKKMLTRPMAELLERRPSLHPLSRLRPEAKREQLKETARELLGELKQEERGVKSARELERLMRERKGICHVGHFLPQQVGLARLAMADVAMSGGEGFGGYLAQIVKETVMHEVGHTLGLRHNFKASSWLPLSKINSKERPEAISASVMDYHPVNLSAPDDPQGNFLAQTVGPYDMLAIQYGYALVKEDSKELKAIPRQVSAQGIPYATDEDLGSPDPMIAQWDLGDDPVAFAAARAALVKKLWQDLEKRTVEDDQSYSRLRRALNVTLFEVQFSSMNVARQVGGLDFSRDHRGDPKAREPIALIPADSQRAALKWICENILEGKALEVPAGIGDKLAASRWLDWSARGNPSLDYSLLDRIHAIQSWAVFFLTSDDVLARVWENERRELRKDKNAKPLTLPELFETIEAAVFGELQLGEGAEATVLEPLVSSQRQLLQDAYMRRMIAISLGNGVSPPVANKLAWSRLAGLEARFGRVLAQLKLDPYTKSHLETLRSRSSKVRNAEYVHLASGGDALCALTAPEAPVRWLPILLLLLGLAALHQGRRRALAA
ncbi:MAG TPA: hypothetical protein DEA08_38570 [Planctomycetes bacterium]|nr:hypothetical protein [Planctomycetota bacterium]